MTWGSADRPSLWRPVKETKELASIERKGFDINQSFLKCTSHQTCRESQALQHCFFL